MRPALSLQAYLAYTKGKAEGYRAPDMPQLAVGQVILGVADSAADAVTLERIASRLALLEPDIRLVLSGAGGSKGTAYLDLPLDNERDAMAFAKSLNPAIVLWSGHSLRPALLRAFSKLGTDLIHVNATSQGFTTPAPKWIPDLSGAALAFFDKVFCNDNATRYKLQRYGVSPERIFEVGPLFDAGPTLTCPDAMHEEASELLAARPLWLAAHVHAVEAQSVLQAHRLVSHLAHRLILVLVPHSAAAHREIAKQIELAEMSCCHWDDGYMPDQNTQIILTESPEELGLWYRLSPFAFLGGSLSPGLTAQDPFAAASLGSAVLYGPNVAGHTQAYSHLVNAGAARIVRDAESLATAVERLLAPDLAASMAHAGWEVASQGAEAVDRVIEEVMDALDMAKVA